MHRIGAHRLRQATARQNCFVAGMLTSVARVFILSKMALRWISLSNQ